MKTYDRRPGFYYGRRTAGYVEPSGRRRKPWAGVIEREWTHFEPIMRVLFKTETEAEAWVMETLQALNDHQENRRQVKP